MAKALGIDCSKWQPALDWVRMRDAGYSFAYLRYGVGDGSDGSGVDPMYSTHLAGVRKTDMRVGVYWYMWSINIPKQIELFTQIDHSQFELPPALDVEQANISEDNLKLFLREIERITGRVPVVYTRKDIIQSIVGAGKKDWLSRYFLWIAQYPAVVGEHPTLLPDSWTNYSFWQFTSTGQVPGYSGNMDINVYNGTIDDMCCQFNYPKNLVLEWPVDSSVVTQEFGANPSSYSQFGLLGHDGVDFRASTGANVYSMTDGIVKEVNYSSTYGNYIRIDTQKGYEFTYAHLSQWLVSVGQRVVAKQRIGLAGNTGNSSGAHLHVTGYAAKAGEAVLYSFPKGIFNFSPFLKRPNVITGVLMRNKSGLVLEFRAEPSISSTDIGDIPVGAIVTAYPPAVNDYLPILYSGVRGYALAKQFELVAVRLRSIAQPYVNIRSGPSVSSTDIGNLNFGEEIMGYPVQGDAFWRVIYNNADAWISAQWLEVVP